MPDERDELFAKLCSGTSVEETKEIEKKIAHLDFCRLSPREQLRQKAYAQARELDGETVAEEDED